MSNPIPPPVEIQVPRLGQMPVLSVSPSVLAQPSMIQTPQPIIPQFLPQISSNPQQHVVPRLDVPTTTPAAQIPSVFPPRPKPTMAPVKPMPADVSETSNPESFSNSNQANGEGLSVSINDDDSLDMDHSGSSVEDAVYHPKLPILRLKKKLTGGDENTTFEKQDVSKNDSYCWVCHDGGDVLCCDKCARVFHFQCSGLPHAPEGDEDWFCPVCKNIARKTKRSRPSALRELLLLAVKRMSFEGTEIFQQPVPEDILTHYREYIFFPMDLGQIKKRVEGRGFHSTREFTHEAEWILHNCIIYNGAKHALTKMAKQIVKICKEDMREIELCPSCYELTCKTPKDWFCIPCNPPHRVVLAKIRGFPTWPAKLISETSDKCDVRFFGQHDRSLVPRSCVQELNGPPPTPTSKTQHWNIAMMELRKYRESIDIMMQKISGGGKGSKFKEGRMIGNQDESPVSNHDAHSLKESPPYSHEASMISQHHLAISNHIPYSPQLVEVTPLSEAEDGSILGNSAMVMQPNDEMISEPSTPGSPPELQIDLDGTAGLHKGGDKNSPLKGSRIGQPASRSLLGNLNKRTSSHSPGNFEFNSSNTQSNTGPVFDGGASASNLLKFKLKKMPGRKPGAVLTALATSLAERRVAELSGPPVGSSSPGTPPSSQENSNTSEVGGDSEQTTEDGMNNSFSSIYQDRCKTHITVVDPDQKRSRKRPKNKFPDPPPKKSARVQNTTAKVPTINNATTAPPSSNEPDLPRALPPPPLPPAPPSQTVIPSLPPSTPSPSTTLPASLHVEPITIRPTTTASPAAKLDPKTSTPNKSAKNTTAAKTVLSINKKSPVKKPRGMTTPAGGKKVAKGRSKAATSRQANAARSSATTVANSNTMGGMSFQANGGLSKIVTPTIGGVPLMSNTPIFRPEIPLSTASIQSHNFEEEEMPDITEGSGGLLADTIRKVDRSFRARVNQMSGGSEDMGYQYFTEKLMTSIKTVLIEMLSMFEAKGKMSAKALKEQLHSGWPVPDSRMVLASLRKELLDEMRQSLEVVRASSDIERQQVVSEVRRQVEKEKEIAINETKRKKWCNNCLKEAQYNCCWNANYCNENCQQAHWPEHMKTCTQIQQPQQTPTQQAAPSSVPPPRTPVAMEIPAGTPVAKAPPSQLAMITVGAGGGGGGGGGIVVTPNDPSQHQTFFTGQPVSMINTVSPSSQPVIQHMSGNIHHHHQQQQQQQHQQQQHHHQQQQHPHCPPPHYQGHHQQHHRAASEMPHERATNERMLTDMHATQPSYIERSPMERAVAHIEHIPNESMITNTSIASPPNHIRNLLLNQQLASAAANAAKSQVITSAGLPIMLSHHQSSSNAVPQLVSDVVSSGNIGGPRSMDSAQPGASAMLHSPVSPQESGPSIGSYSWGPYQQIIGTEGGFPHTLPLLPAMQANTPTTTNQVFFKAF